MQDIKGYEKLYAITNDGKIWSYGNRPGANHSGKFLKLKKDKDGYLEIVLQKNKISKFKRVHRLVAETYIPNPNNKPEVNHKNGIRSDNRVQNLEWVTTSENIRHSFKILNKNQKGINNNAFKSWGYTIENTTRHFDDMSVDEWCATFNNGSSSIVYVSMRENRKIKRGKLKGYQFFRL